MWIRSQDKSELVKVINLRISKIIGDKNVKASIWGKYSSNGIFSSNEVLLGRYENKETALEVLSEIEKFIIENPNGIYQMK